MLLNLILPWHIGNLYEDPEPNSANLAQLTQALPPGILFTVVLESHTMLTCQAGQQHASQNHRQLQAT